MENKIKHLEMIQNIINRMSNNSFLLKGWTVTLIAGLFALAAKDANKIFFIISYIPIILFWFLDSYYLYMERLFRDLYNEVRNLKESDIDFSMEIKKEIDKLFKCLFSSTELVFYIPLILLSSVVVLVSCI